MCIRNEESSERMKNRCSSVHNPDYLVQYTPTRRILSEQEVLEFIWFQSMANHGVTDWMLLKLLYLLSCIHFLQENWEYCAPVIEVYNSIYWNQVHLFAC